MKEVNHCPICFQSRSELRQCSKHGVPYDLLAEWANERRFRNVEEFYHGQIPVLQVLLGGLSDFATRAEQCSQMNERLAETIAFLTDVEKLGSYHLSILQLLSEGGELIETAGRWFIRDSNGITQPSELLKEEELDPLEQMGYIESMDITDSGREAFRIYKTAHPLLFDLSAELDPFLADLATKPPATIGYYPGDAGSIPPENIKAAAFALEEDPRVASVERKYASRDLVRYFFAESPGSISTLANGPC